MFRFISKNESTHCWVNFETFELRASSASPIAVESIVCTLEAGGSN